MAIKTRVEPDAQMIIDPNLRIELTVTVGNVQIGGSVVRFKGDLEPIDKGRIKNLLIGQGSDLIGKTLEVVTTVLDSNKSTNKISITHKFPGCMPASFLYQDEVDAERDILSLTATYVFQ